MKYQSISLGFIFLITILTTLSFPLLQINAQVPAEEFKMTPTCTNSEVQPSEKENNEGLITDKEEFFIYGDASLGYKIAYPKDWKGIEQHCTLEAEGLVQTSSIVNFMSTLNSKTYGLLGVQVGDFPIDISIDEFIKVFSKDFGNMIESNEIITIDNQPSVKFIMNAGDGYKFTQIIILSNDQKYDITYPISNLISPSTIQSMIQSFEIVDKEAVLNSEDASEINELG
jgi:hypothetical protein